jgi:predicted HNH restriction endonuclease
MLENGYVYKKEADWSLLNWGLSIPVDIQVIFLDGIKDFISRGESKDINLVLDGNTYKAKLVNQKFNEKKYPNHRDILRIRYSPNSELADKIRNIFFCTYNYLCEQRGIEKVSGKRYFKIPEEKKEFLVIYTTEYQDTYLLEYITQAEAAEARELLVNENEQKYETSVNYAETDPTASIERVNQLVKIRKLNRAIGDTLKMLYEYRCQICGNDFGKKFDVHIVESHHINPFVISMNNDASNQMIVCPNHHKVIHRAEPFFDRRRLLFVYSNGVEERVVLNRHL